MSVSEALLALSRHQPAVAVEILQDDRTPLATALLRYLTSDGSDQVYSGSEPLSQFIGGGTNAEMYRLLEDDLRSRYDVLQPTSLLDVGCGDGRVVEAVCVSSMTNIDMVEPSASLLADATSRLATSGRGGTRVMAYPMTAAAFVAQCPSEKRWDAAQSTFALHTMAAHERAVVLRELASRTRHLAVVEFDVPNFVDHSRQHAEYCADRYERGIAEYPDNEIVQQGFLMPVLVGQFDPSKPRHTYEQSTDRWSGELTHAGFTKITATKIFDYWWAPAMLITAEVGRTI